MTTPQIRGWAAGAIARDMSAGEYMADVLGTDGDTPFRRQTKPVLKAEIANVRNQLAAMEPQIAAIAKEAAAADAQNLTAFVTERLEGEQQLDIVEAIVHMVGREVATLASQRDGQAMEQGCAA